MQKGVTINDMKLLKRKGPIKNVCPEMKIKIYGMEEKRVTSYHLYQTLKILFKLCKLADPTHQAELDTRYE